MSALSIQNVASSRTIRLAGSTLACGLSLAFALSAAFRVSIVDELARNRPLRSVELSVLNPILNLNAPKLRAQVLPSPFAPIADVLPITMPAPNREVRKLEIRKPENRPVARIALPVVQPSIVKLAPDSSVPKAPFIAPQVTTRNVSAVTATLKKATPPKAVAPKQVAFQLVAKAKPSVPAPAARVQIQRTKNFSAAALAPAKTSGVRVNADAHWHEILEIAEYITGDNLGLKAPAPLEARGVLIAEVTAHKAIQVIDGGPTLEEAAWLALVEDAERVHNKDLVYVAAAAKSAGKRKPVAPMKPVAKITLPRFHILEANPTEPVQDKVDAREMSATDIEMIAAKDQRSAQAAAAPAVSAKTSKRQVRDQVNNLVGALARDLDSTEPTMGIQEERAPNDAAAGEIVTLAKGILLENAASAAQKPKEIKIPEPTTGTQIAKTTPPVDDKAMKVRGAGNSHSRNVQIYGKLANEARGYPGHFEIGFYKAVSPAGVPIGAPVLQSILKNKQLEFSLNTPRAAQGFLYARFITADANFKANEWHGYPTALDLREIQGDQILLTIPLNKKVSIGAAKPEETVAALSPAIQTILKGRVGAMFSPKGTLLPLEGTKVRVRGTKLETAADKTGRYILKIPGAKGRVLIEFLNPGYMPRIVEVGIDAGGEIQVPDATIANREAIRHMAHSLGLQHSSTGSVVILETKGRTADAGLPGISAQMSLKGDGPFYFSEKGFPQRELKSTTTDGRIIYFNVEPGVGFLETFVLGENFTPIAIAPLGAGEAMVQTIEFLDGDARITGKVFDPIASRNGAPIPINGAKVRVAGGAEWTETDSFGNFELPNFKFVRGAEILIEVTKHGYYNHRFQYRVPKEKSGMRELQLFAFPQEYINRLATSVEVELNPDYGMLMGKVGGGERMRVDALLDHSGDNGAKDYYFDSHNVIQGAHALTDPGFGTYMIFDVSPGRVLLQGHNIKGELRYSDVSYFSPSTINVIISD